MFLQQKAMWEQLVLSYMPIIVTTCAASRNQSLLPFRFTHVIIDEATQAKEVEILATIGDARQVVLIGDHKQLGPIYSCDVPNCDSMLTRLIEAKYSHFKML
jgi:regulator of nonsense transcripts 1